MPYKLKTRNTPRKKEVRKNKKPDNGAGVYNRYTTGLDVALAFGFVLIPTPKINDTDCKNAKELKTDKNGDGDTNLIAKPEEKLALLRMYQEEGMQSWQQPAMVYYEGMVERERGTRDARERLYHLDILNTHRSIAEAIIIETGFAILRDSGFVDMVLEINSLGDKDSMARYGRELTNYYRSHIDDLPSSCKHAFKKSVFDILNCDHEKCKELAESAPKPINFLSELSRIHFKELLEYLESADVPYRIASNLVGDRDFCSHTTYRIIGREKDGEMKTLARGIRYNSLSKRAGFKKEMGATGLTICFRKKKAEKTMPKKVKLPRFYFIQMGDEAKHKSLPLIEMLRQEGIRVSHTITRDKLGAQLSVAEQVATSHVIIMGQKEFYENVVLVRRMSDRSQETIHLDNLVSYLKKIK